MTPPPRISPKEGHLSRTPPGRARLSRMRAAAVVIVVAASIVGSFVVTGPIIRVLHDVTGGNRFGDVIAGVLAFWGPLVVVCVVALVNRKRRGSRPRDAWLLLLFLPTVALVPFSRYGTNTSLEHRLNTSLPDFLGGLVGGALVLIVPMMLLGTVLRIRRRSTSG